MSGKHPRYIYMHVYVSEADTGFWIIKTYNMDLLLSYAMSDESCHPLWTFVHQVVAIWIDLLFRNLENLQTYSALHKTV